ncbi:IS3 family transposase [Flavobacterium sp. 9R]|uniref:IS3 family transposase n=1 Tax=Flavobacterium sp. 9R TaxID=2653143 RepID=UPI00351B2341
MCKLKSQGFGFYNRSLFSNIRVNWFKTTPQFRIGIDQYINYYNNDRTKSNLNKMSPTKYRAHHYQN